MKKLAGLITLKRLVEIIFPGDTQPKCAVPLKVKPGAMNAEIVHTFNDNVLTVLLLILRLKSVLILMNAICSPKFVRMVPSVSILKDHTTVSVHKD